MLTILRRAARGIPGPDPDRRLTVGQARKLLAAGAVILIVTGWGGEYRSCVRSAFWVGYFNRLSASYMAQATRSAQFAQVSLRTGDTGRYHLDLKAAAAARDEAKALRVQPLVCLHFPLPEVPQRGL